MKIALLDDNPEQLERNQRFLSTLPVEVVTASLTAKTFLQEVKLSKPEILILDLNLGDSYMTGMEVAHELKLPVLFASSNTPEYVKEMERLKREESLCVDHITKPFTEQEFQKTLSRFLQEVTFFSNQSHVTLDLGKDCNISQYKFFLGSYELEDNRNLTITFADSSNNTTATETLTDGSVFHWEEKRNFYF